MFCGLGHSCLGLSVALGAYSPLATPCPRPWRADVSTNGIRVAFLCYGYFMLVGKQTASVSRIRELRHATVNNDFLQYQFQRSEHGWTRPALGRIFTLIQLHCMVLTFKPTKSPKSTQGQKLTLTQANWRSTDKKLSERDGALATAAKRRKRLREIIVKRL